MIPITLYNHCDGQITYSTKWVAWKGAVLALLMASIIETPMHLTFREKLHFRNIPGMFQ